MYLSYLIYEYNYVAVLVGNKGLNEKLQIHHEVKFFFYSNFEHFFGNVSDELQHKLPNVI